MSVFLLVCLQAFVKGIKAVQIIPIVPSASHDPNKYFLKYLLPDQVCA